MLNQFRQWVAKTITPKPSVTPETEERTRNRRLYHEIRVAELNVLPTKAQNPSGFTKKVTASNGITADILDLDNSCAVWPCKALQNNQIVRICFVKESRIGFLMNGELLFADRRHRGQLTKAGTYQVQELVVKPMEIESFFGGVKVPVVRPCKIFRFGGWEMISPNLDGAITISLVDEPEVTFPIYGNKMDQFQIEISNYTRLVNSWIKNPYDANTNPNGTKLRLFTKHNGVLLNYAADNAAGFHVVWTHRPTQI